MALESITQHDIKSTLTLRYITFTSTLHYITEHCKALGTITQHDINNIDATLHYITLH